MELSVFAISTSEKPRHPTLQAILEVIAAIETQIAALEKEINEHINNHPHLKNMVENIKTIKGIGHLTAIAVVAEMPSVDNFDHARLL